MRESEKGFTLMEIVAALVLLALVAVPLARTFMDSFKFQAKSQLKTEANEVAQFVAEKLKEGTLEKMNTALETDSELSEDITLFSSELGMSGAANEYEINITLKSLEKGAAVGGSTPSDFEYKLTVDENGLVSQSSVDSVYYEDSILTIAPNDDGAQKYNFLIENISETENVSIKVYKTTTSTVTFYKKGMNEIYLSSMTNELSSKQVAFREFNLGTEDQVTSTTQDLYNVIISVKSTTDESISATMATTFTRAVETSEEI